MDEPEKPKPTYDEFIGKMTTGFTKDFDAIEDETDKWSPEKKNEVFEKMKVRETKLKNERLAYMKEMAREREELSRKKK